MFVGIDLDRLCLRLCGRTLCGALRAPALAPLVGIGRRNRRLDNRSPVELDAGVLQFERLAHAGIERLPSHLHVRRGAKPVEDALAYFSPTIRRRLNQIEILDAALVA